MVLGGDGRYGNLRAIDVILRMGAAHGLSKVIVTTGGILSTPAASNLIRKRQAIGGIILSASHNPGGPEGDFGVKVNGSNGGPTPASFTDAVYECTKTLEQYSIVEAATIPLDSAGLHSVGAMQVEVIDGVDDFVSLMQELFDFDKIRDLIHSDFPLAFDAMHAVTGPYAMRLFEGLLGAPAGSVRNGTPLEDFGGGHPDPNLTYAHELAELLLEGDAYRFGAACDGDGDRNMILGQRCFVNPSDSLAVLTANATLAPAYASGLVEGDPCPPALLWMWWPESWASSALKPRQAGNSSAICWMPAGSPSAVRSFGTGSPREKDGPCCLRQIPPNAAAAWPDHGRALEALRRHYYSRHDYEAVASDAAHGLYDRLVGQSFAGRKISAVDNFSYTDRRWFRDHGQGLRILLDDGSRAVVRLSTGTKGATIRAYLESYVPSKGTSTRIPRSPWQAISAINDLAEISSAPAWISPP